MNQFDRPIEPQDWPQKVKKVQTRLRQRIVKSPQRPLSKKAIPPLWRDSKVTFMQRNGDKLTVKEIFSQAQNGLCGYCAVNLIPTGTGELDHYRPARSIKRQIWIPGEEMGSGISRVKGRRLRPNPPHRPGFWDEAYSWSNYVFCCERCNVAWKRDLCVSELNGKPHLGERDPQEKSLLLNPFEKVDTSLHLEFYGAGLVKGKTGRGRATIQTCGLDRPSLVTDRVMFVELAELHCKNIQGCTDKTKLRDCYKKLVARGSWKNAHALVVRQTAERKLGVPWSVIEKRAK